MGNKLCATWQKDCHDSGLHPWPARKDIHRIRLWAEIFEVREENGQMFWGRVSDDVVPVNVVCIQDSPNTVYQITAYNSLVKKIFDIQLIQPGTVLIQASECFIHWRDNETNHEWGLNFTSPCDARQFRDNCMSRVSHGLSRKASSSESLRPKSRNKQTTSAAGSSGTPSAGAAAGAKVCASNQQSSPSQYHSHCAMSASVPNDSDVDSQLCAENSRHARQQGQVVNMFVDNWCPENPDHQHQHHQHQSSSQLLATTSHCCNSRPVMYDAANGTLYEVVSGASGGQAFVARRTSPFCTRHARSNSLSPSKRYASADHDMLLYGAGHVSGSRTRRKVSDQSGDEDECVLANREISENNAANEETVDRILNHLANELQPADNIPTNQDTSTNNPTNQETLENGSANEETVDSDRTSQDTGDKSPVKHLVVEAGGESSNQEILSVHDEITEISLANSSEMSCPTNAEPEAEKLQNGQPENVESSNILNLPDLMSGNTPAHNIDDHEAADNCNEAVTSNSLPDVSHSTGELNLPDVSFGTDHKVTKSAVLDDLLQQADIVPKNIFSTGLDFIDDVDSSCCNGGSDGSNWQTAQLNSDMIDLNCSPCEPDLLNPVTSNDNDSSVFQHDPSSDISSDWPIVSDSLETADWMPTPAETRVMMLDHIPASKTASEFDSLALERMLNSLSMSPHQFADKEDDEEIPEDRLEESSPKVNGDKSSLLSCGGAVTELLEVNSESLSDLETRDLNRSNRSSVCDSTSELDDRPHHLTGHLSELSQNDDSLLSCLVSAAAAAAAASESEQAGVTAAAKSEVMVIGVDDADLDQNLSQNEVMLSETLERDAHVSQSDVAAIGLQCNNSKQNTSAGFSAFQLCGCAEEICGQVKHASATYRSSAVRLSGWLNVRSWLHHHGDKLHISPVQTLKRSWVCLRGGCLDLYSDVSAQNGPAHFQIVIEGGLVQPFVEPQNIDKMFTISTACGDVFIFHVEQDSDVTTWLTAVHIACAATIARHLGRDATVRLLQAKIRQLETSIDLDVKMKRMAARHVTTMNGASSRLAVERQLKQWDDNLDRLRLSHYRSACYVAALQRVDLPNPMMLLCEVSKNAKEALVATVGCGVTVASFHAFVSARCELTRSRQVGAASGYVSHAFARQLKHNLAIDGEMSTFKANSPMASQLAVTPLSSGGKSPKVSAENSPQSTLMHCGAGEYKLKLLRSDHDVDFGMTFDACLSDNVDVELTLCVSIRDVNRGGVAYRQGVKVGDKLVSLDGHLVSQLDMIYIESVLKSCASASIVLTTFKPVETSQRVEPQQEEPKIPAGELLTGETQAAESKATEPQAAEPQATEPPSEQRALQQVEPLAARANSTRSVTPQPGAGAAGAAAACGAVAEQPSRNIPDLLQTRSSSCPRQPTYCCSASRDLQQAQYRQMPAGSLYSALRPLANSQRIRKVVIELLDTERQYVRDLMNLIHHYLEPLRGKTFIPCEEMEQLFASVYRITQFHRQFVNGLENIIERTILEFGATDDILRDEILRRILVLIASLFVFNAQHFKLYSLFCACHSRMQKIILSESNPALQGFLRSCTPRQQLSVTFESYLIKPIQRILKYPLLLRQLTELTEMYSDEHRHLTEALRGMQAVAEHMNEMQKIYDEYGVAFDDLSRESVMHCKAVNLSVSELQMYGTVKWLNASDALGKIKKSTEITTVVFIFKSAIVLLAHERIKLKKKSKMLSSQSSSGAAAECQDLLRFRIAMPVDQIQVRTVIGEPSQPHAVWEIAYCRLDGHGRLAKTVYQFLSSHKARNDFIRTIHHTMHDSVYHSSVPIGAAQMQQHLQHRHVHQHQPPEPAERDESGEPSAILTSSQGQLPTARRRSTGAASNNESPNNSVYSSASHYGTVPHNRNTMSAAQHRDKCCRCVSVQPSTTDGNVQ